MSYSMPNEMEVSRYMMTLQIHSDEDNDRAIELAEHLTDLYESGQTEIEPLLDYVTGLIVKYEDEHYPIEKPAPVEVLRHLMENHNHRQSDLADVASRTVINEILSGKRKLNLGHIERLAGKYGVSPTLFMDV